MCSIGQFRIPCIIRLALSSDSARAQADLRERALLLERTAALLLRRGDGGGRGVRGAALDVAAVARKLELVQG